MIAHLGLCWWDCLCLVVAHPCIGCQTQPLQCNQGPCKGIRRYNAPHNTLLLSSMDPLHVRIKPVGAQSMLPTAPTQRPVQTSRALLRLCRLGNCWADADIIVWLVTTHFHSAC